MKVSIAKQLNLTLIHHVKSTMVLATKKNVVYSSSDEGESWLRFCKFPFVLKRDLFNFCRLSARLMRADKCNVYANKYNNIIGVRDGVVYQLNQNSAARKLFSIQGDCALQFGVSEDAEGNIYICEYFTNPHRVPVRVHRLSPDLSRWEVAHEFAAGEVRHIHGIYLDPYEPNTLWLPSGDDDGECYFYKTADGFKTLEKIGTGNQIWRAVTLLFTPTHICWLTDSHTDQNYACRLNRSNKELEIGRKIESSAWYGTMTTEKNFVMFTTVENGAGVKTVESGIFYSADAWNWSKVYAFKKDRWEPKKLFKNGVITCPSGKMSLKKLFISGEALIGLDGQSAVLDICDAGHVNQEQLEKMIRFVELKKSDDWFFGKMNKKEVFVNKCHMVSDLYQVALATKDFRALNAALKLEDTLSFSILCCLFSSYKHHLFFLIQKSKRLALKGLNVC